MKKAKKSSKKRIFAGLITTGLVIAGGVAGTLYYINNKNKNSVKNEDNIVLSKGDKIKFGSWNIANLSTKSIPRLQYRQRAIKDVINDNQLDLLSIQELSYDEEEPLKRIVEALGNNWSYKVSIKGVYSQSRPKSKEAYGIIYRNDKLRYLNEEGSYLGKDVEYTRPLWYSKWEILQDKQQFWIINGHLDAPGKSNTENVNEDNSPTIDNYKWTNQGDQEVKEYLDIKNLFTDIKKKDINTLIIFNGDTNIKKENFTYASDYYTKLGYETNYETNTFKDVYATSLGNKSYANPYDKIIAYDPNGTFEGNKFLKYDLIHHINNENRAEYTKLFNSQYHSNKAASDFDMVKKISDHTLIVGYINIKSE